MLIKGFIFDGSATAQMDGGATWVAATVYLKYVKYFGVGVILQPDIKTRIGSADRIRRRSAR